MNSTIRLIGAACHRIRHVKDLYWSYLREVQNDVEDRNGLGCLARDTYRHNDEGAKLIYWKKAGALGSDKMVSGLTSPSR